MSIPTHNAGYIRARSFDFEPDQQVPSRHLDRLGEDAALLSDKHAEDHRRHHYPQVHTSDYKMSVTAQADQITLGDNVYLTVAGVTFNTHDLSSRVIAIPDSATKYLYAQVASDCGDVVDADVDPVARKLTVSLTLEDTEVASTATKMLILQAVKAGAGSTPTVTTYANFGHSHVQPDLSNYLTEDHLTADPAHTAAQISFDNAVAGLPGSPTRSQAALEALASLTMVFAAGGTANALTATPSPAWGSLTDKRTINILIASTNTGAATLAVSGLTAKTVVRPDGGALAANDLVANGLYCVAYNSGLDKFVATQVYGRIQPLDTSSSVASFSGAQTNTVVDCSSLAPAGAKGVKVLWLIDTHSQAAYWAVSARANGATNVQGGAVVLDINSQFSTAYVEFTTGLSADRKFSFSLATNEGTHYTQYFYVTAWW